MPNAMYNCPMTQPPTLSINLPLGNLTVPVRMSPSYIPPAIISPPVTCTVTSTSIVPPPPYHAINLNSIPCDGDIDVVGITDVARDVRLDDDDGGEEQYDKVTYKLLKFSFFFFFKNFIN